MPARRNLCVYKGTPDHTLGDATWCSMAAASTPGDYFVILQNDGELNVYNGTLANPGSLLWSSAA